MSRRGGTTWRDICGVLGRGLGAVHADSCVWRWVIGSVHAGKLLEAGHDVALLDRGRRLTDLQFSGLTLEEAGVGAADRSASPGSGPGTSASIPTSVSVMTTHPALPGIRPFTAVPRQSPLEGFVTTYCSLDEGV